MWNDLRQDIAYAVRGLVRTPGFTIAATLTLALGIGANTAIFSVINAVLFRPLPYKDSRRLVFVWSSSSAFPLEPLTPGRLVDFRQRMSSAQGLAGISHISLNLTGGGDPERLSGSSVSSGFFDVLGVRPLLGDTFHTGRADDRDVVLGYGLWKRRFAGDSSVIGREIVVNGTARRIVAVMPADFEWPSVTATGSSNASPPELWIPGTHQDIPRMPLDDPNQDLAGNRSSGYLRAVARLKDTVSVEQAQREAELIATRLAEEHPNEDVGRGAVVQPLRDQFFGNVRRPLFVLLGAVALVLGIACANAASLLLGRAAARSREIALRLALGASRGRIIRQLLTESVVLALGAALCGLAVAAFVKGWLVSMAPAGLLRLEQSGIDVRVLGFTAAIAVATGILFGLVPARQVSARAVTDDLADGGARASAGPRSTRARDILVGAEISIALILLVGAGLLVRSLSALSHVDTGIATRNLLTFDVILSGDRAQYQRKQVAFYNDALRAIVSLPGVRDAGAAVTLPIGGDDFAAEVAIEGQPAPPRGQEPRAGYQVVTGNYFHTMGIPLTAGRSFRESDTRDALPVVMVNQAFARMHWPRGDTIGRRVRIGSASSPWATVVGIVGNIRHLGPAVPPRPEIYEAVTQRSFPFMAFVVRTEGDPHAMIPSIRAAIATLDPAQPISGARTMDEHIERALSRPRFMSTLVAAFGAVAVTLAIIGVYGVMAYAVTQRRREIAIRAALGAQPRDLVRLILTRTVWIACAGIVAGLIGAAGLTRALAGLLFEVRPTDPRTFVIVTLLLLTVALCAGIVPALRASRIDATNALK